MSLSPQQIAQLNALNQKISSGYKPNNADTGNLNFAKSEGYTYKPLAAGATKITDPNYLKTAGLNESQIYRSGVDIYQLPNIPNQLGSTNISGGTNIQSVDSTAPDTAPYVAAFDTGNKGAEAALKNALTASPAEAKIQPLVDRKNELVQQGYGEQADYTNTLNQYGFQEDFTSLKNILTQSESVKAAYDKQMEAVKDSNGLTRIIGGTADRLSRQSAIELGALSSMAQALQGNMEMAQSIAEKTTNLKYDAIEADIKNQEYQLEQVYSQLSREDQRRADAQLIALNERARLIAEQKQTETDISNIMAQAAQNGAKQDVLTKIMKSKDASSAIVAAGIYLQPASKGLSISEKTELYLKGLTVDDEGNVIKIPTNPGTTLLTPGELGGQCGDYLHKIADNIPSLGDLFEEKMKKANASTATYKVGDVLIQKTNMPYGHVSIVTAVNGNQATVMESNWGLDEKVGTRTITMGDKSVKGVYRGAILKEFSPAQTFSQTAIDWAERIRDGKAKLSDITTEVEKNNPGLKSEVVAVSKTLPPSQQQIKEAQDFVKKLEELRSSPGLKFAVGPVGVARGGVFGLQGVFGSKDAFLGKADSLISKKALDSLIEAKSQGATFGALSDTEMAILKAAGTSLGAWSTQNKNGKLKNFDVDEATFKQELNNLIADYQDLLSQANITQSLDSYLQNNPDKVDEYNRVVSQNPDLSEEEILQVIQ